MDQQDGIDQMDGDDFHLMPLERATMMLYRRIGVRRFILLITASSIILSVLMTVALVVPQFYLDYPDEAVLPIAVGIAVVVPLLVAPTSSWLVLRLLDRLNKANQALVKLSTTDPLTGASNRRGFFAEAANRLHSWRHTDCCLVGMVDLDAFKTLNDRFGHQFGDETLKAVAHRLQCSLGEGIVGRLGGDEFALLITGSPARIEQVRQEIRAQCSNFTIYQAGSGEPITVSTSIGMVLLQREESFDQVLARADKALYAAKRPASQPQRPVPGTIRCRERQDSPRFSRNPCRISRRYSLQNFDISGQVGRKKGH